MDTALLPPLATAADYAAVAGPAPGLDVTALLASASALIRAHCRWHIFPQVTEDLVVDGSGTALLLLPTMALRDVTAVTDLGVTVDLADVAWSAGGWIRRISPTPTGYGQRFSAAERGVVVTVVHGLDIVPEVTALAVTVAARAAASPAGIIREAVGAINVSYSQPAANTAGGFTLMQYEKDTLAAYRLTGVR